MPKHSIYDYKNIIICAIHDYTWLHDCVNQNPSFMLWHIWLHNYDYVAMAITQKLVN